MLRFVLCLCALKANVEGILKAMLLGRAVKRDAGFLGKLALRLVEGIDAAHASSPSEPETLSVVVEELEVGERPCLPPLLEEIVLCKILYISRIRYVCQGGAGNIPPIPPPWKLRLKHAQSHQRVCKDGKALFFTISSCGICNVLTPRGHRHHTLFTSTVVVGYRSSYGFCFRTKISAILYVRRVIQLVPPSLIAYFCGKHIAFNDRICW